ncbi:hypothetical protein JB92DRAFT_3044894 [Gautieria morchelliformis]|nr:hypothetical protein JB92DRAFT_3044894 [Gautieria morchelliformis]
MSKLLDTIVIGAGWSGLVAARDLATKGHSVLVLEARERIGGRANTVTHGMHAPIDLGCSWIHGYKEGNPAREIASRLGVNTYLGKDTEKVVYGPDGPLSPSVVSQLGYNIRSSMAAAHNLAQTRLPSPSTSIPLSEFLLSQGSPLFLSSEPALASDFARALEIPLAAPLEKISLRWIGWENTFGGSDAAPEAGFQHLVEKLNNEAQSFGSETRLGERVNSLKRREDGWIAVVTDKAVYNARTVVCTIPLGVLKQDPPSFTPPLPARRLETIAGTHVGVLEKLVLVYPVAWWPGGSSVGSFTFLPNHLAISKDYSDAKAVLASHSLVMLSFAAPTLPNPHPTLVIYLSSTPAQLLARFSTNDVTHAAHAFLVERFNPTFSPPNPVTGVKTNWMDDPLARGATTTPSVIGEGRSPLDFTELGKPLWDGQLGFAGEHTDADHRGSVAGAVVSGQREAARVARLLAQQ